MSDGLSLAYLARHTSAGRRPIPLGGHRSLSLRDVVNRPSGRVRLSSTPGAFSVLSHNMALMPPPADYKGTDRSGAIGQIVAEILALGPSVVGLCEVWVDGEKNTIHDALREVLPSSLDGPDEDALKWNGGLLLMSHNTQLTSASHVYRDCDGVDCLADKGVLHIRVLPSGFPTQVDVFFSHTQDISTGDGPEALYAQLSDLNAFVEARRDPDIPALIMGDLNIPGEDFTHYEQLRLRLGDPTDCWTVVGNPPTTGFTEVVDSNFYDDPDDRPAQDQRLDYVLLKPGRTVVPMVAGTNVLRFTHDGRFISDHFGILASFDRIAHIDG